MLGIYKNLKRYGDERNDEFRPCEGLSVYAEWRILCFVRLASRTSEKPFVIKDLLEYLEELGAETQGPRPITSSQGFLPFFLSAQLIPRIRTLIVVPFLLVLLADGIDLASRLTADC